MGRRGTKVIYTCILRNSLLNIKTTIKDFFVVEYLFVRPKISGCAHVAWSWHTRSQRKKKVTESDAPTVITIVAINYDEVKNIKSDDCVRFTQLQRK